MTSFKCMASCSSILFICCYLYLCVHTVDKQEIQRIHELKDNSSSYPVIVADMSFNHWMISSSVIIRTICGWISHYSYKCSLVFYDSCVRSLWYLFSWIVPKQGFFPCLILKWAKDHILSWQLLISIPGRSQSQFCLTILKKPSSKNTWQMWSGFVLWRRNRITTGGPVFQREVWFYFCWTRHG